MKKAIPFVLIIACVAAMALVFDWSSYFSDGEFQNQLETIKEENFVSAAVLYVVVMVICCVALALPGVVFALVGGAIFGAFWGTFLCWFAAVIGACLSFVLGRYFLRDEIAPKLKANERLQSVLFDNAGRSDVYLIAITRLIPVFPYNLQNFAYGVTGIGFVPYALYSALFMIPGTAAYTFLAAGVLSGQDRVPLVIFALVLIGATSGVATLLKRRAGI